MVSQSYVYQIICIKNDRQKTAAIIKKISNFLTRKKHFGYIWKWGTCNVFGACDFFFLISWNSVWKKIEYCILRIKCFLRSRFSYGSCSLHSTNQVMYHGNLNIAFIKSHRKNIQRAKKVCDIIIISKSNK